MGVYNLGQSITVSQTFTVQNVPSDPTTVTWVLEAPDGTETTYIDNAAPETNHPSVGVYLLTITPPAPGVYYWQIEGTGAVMATGTGDFQVLNSEIATQDVDFPEFGPFVTWVDCGDVTACCDLSDDTDLGLINSMGWAASQIMFEISGRQFTGKRERTVRPCVNPGGGCWGWRNAAFAGNSWAWGWNGQMWGWADALGPHCGCSPLSMVRLPGYPVQRITEVKIDGLVIDPSEYRLDYRRYLTAVRPLASDTANRWPSCQALDLPDTEEGTFSVTYFGGIDPPYAGKLAAAALACQFVKGCAGGECALPTQATRIVRQGVTVERISPLADALRSGKTGIAAVDTFLAAYNPNRMIRRPTVFSPDIQPYAKRLGQ